MEVKKNKVFGLLGKNISYSFSRGYFSEKFTKLKLENYSYVNFDIEQISEFSSIVEKNKSIRGMNVTIPYKQEILPFLTKLDKVSKKIGAVNTIKFTKNGRLKGYNTDAFGFENSLKPLLKPHHKKALILGTGGASKAVAYVLKKNNIKYRFVSRKPQKKKEMGYEVVTEKVLNNYHVIINCTPLGTYPEIDKSPKILYKFLTKKHLLYDLIYNPEITTFLAKGKEQGATIKNGLEMLQLQAEESWRIWQQ